MDKKKGRLTQSQINGISWIAVTLVVILAIIFFSRDKVTEATFSDSTAAQNWTEYSKSGHSRQSQHAYRHKNTRKQHYTDSEKQSFYSSEPLVPTRKPLVVELNSADTTTLMLLHGIGPAFARRIVRYREKLGGFIHEEQLLEVYGFTPALLEHIAPHLQLDSGALRKINVNNVELKQFIKHPYVEYYFARDLVNLRSRGVTFATPDDLRAIPSCSDTMLTKLLPYLEF